ncbi:Cytosolic phospholipase A2 zeta [Ceratocystis platani]|uniref:Lysophospholipase n=1 Tax=Ceratocystis fimbriata f. sp. platani TaxID=88771 RepID=A0A0F8DJK5_CERFI|nr:Cytosolic phospholipase A2 zeta [Ceratocystis platani]
MLYPTDEFDQLKPSAGSSVPTEPVSEGPGLPLPSLPLDTAWANFASNFETFSDSMDIEWTLLTDKIVDLILPEWSRLVPAYFRKLQRELSMAPGSLADEIWTDAHDAIINPEIRYAAKVRVSNELCEEEREFVSRRRKMAAVALARYLDLEETDVNPDDVPTIAMCGSGGGLRALVAGAGSLLAAEKDGLLDCVMYTAGVSGSCWLQATFNSSLSSGKVSKVLDHLKARLGVHIAYPPVALDAISSAPTNKYLLEGLVEKLKGDPKAQFGLVDIYGILLSSRLLVPKSHLGINQENFKMSNQQKYIRYGQAPMPIYTAVRHEIPKLDDDNGNRASTEHEKAVAKKEAWFQWFEITPYEFFCEEFSAGIPTWALGRRFNKGLDVPQEDGFHLPEIRMPLLMGVFGSAFCATLNHYYREIQPIMRSISGFAALDQIVTGRSDDLSKVHPIEPATLPNFAYGMHGQLAKTTPESILNSEYIQLMDAGMSNNLPIYPLLRPGRDVEVIIAFDNSADIKNDNWLAVTDGYARQRKIRGWPAGIGWPKGVAPEEAGEQIEKAGDRSPAEARSAIDMAQEQDMARKSNMKSGDIARENGLGYCTVWVGQTSETNTGSNGDVPPPKAIADFTESGVSWNTAGIAVIYLPLLANAKVPGVDPRMSDYLSTWNFVYTPEQVDSVAALAQANYSEGKQQLRACIRAVYERKKKVREDKVKAMKSEKLRRQLRKGIVNKLGEGDHFS